MSGDQLFTLSPSDVVSVDASGARVLPPVLTLKLNEEVVRDWSERLATGAPRPQLRLRLGVAADDAHALLIDSKAQRLNRSRL